MTGLFLADNPTEHGLGRLHVHDPLDAQHLMSTALAATPAPPELARGTQKTWTVRTILDQGQTSQCASYTGRGWLNAAPISCARRSARRSVSGTPAHRVGLDITTG